MSNIGFDNISIERENFTRNKLHLKNSPCAVSVLYTEERFCFEISIRCAAYKILIDCTFLKLPRVYLLSPCINMRNWHDIHTYGEIFHDLYNKKLPCLCLMFPKEREWESSMLINQTLLPWAIEWTEFYEIWLLSGKWSGKGVHSLRNAVKEQ